MSRVLVDNDCVIYADEALRAPRISRRYKIEAVSYCCDYGDYVLNYLDDRHASPNCELLCTRTPRGENAKCPLLKYDGFAVEEFHFPYDEQIFARIRESGALDIVFAPHVDYYTLLKPRTMAVLKRRRIDHHALTEHMHSSRVLVGGRTAYYELPPEYYEVASTIRVAFGVYPMNMPANFNATFKRNVADNGDGESHSDLDPEDDLDYLVFTKDAPSPPESDEALNSGTCQYTLW